MISANFSNTDHWKKEQIRTLSVKEYFLQLFADYQSQLSLETVQAFMGFVRLYSKDGKIPIPEIAKERAVGLSTAGYHCAPRSRIHPANKIGSALIAPHNQGLKEYHKATPDSLSAHEDATEREHLWADDLINYGGSASFKEIAYEEPNCPD